MTTDIYDTALLTGRDAARYLRMPESTLDEWLRDSQGSGLVHGVTPERRGWPRVPFVGIVEAYVLRALRDRGISKRDIRAAADVVRAEFADPYALATKRIATQGIDIFVRLADESIVHAPTRQRAFREVLDEHLRFIEWNDLGQPTRLHLPQFPKEAAVIIDPRFGWGAPVLARSKVKVDDLVTLWRSGESLTTVAEEYDLPVDLVEDVVREAA